MLKWPVLEWPTFSPYGSIWEGFLEEWAGIWTYTIWREGEREGIGTRSRCKASAE